MASMLAKLHRGGLAADEGPQAWIPPSKGLPANQTYARPQTAQSDASSPDVEKQIQDRIAAAQRATYQEGEAAGRQAAVVQLQPIMERMARTIDEVAGFRGRLRHEAEADVVSLAMAISRRILNRELATDPEALLGLVRSALDKLDGREVHRVRAQAQDAAVLRQFFERLGSPHKIEVYADPSLPPGSAIFETTNGSLDASVEAQLKEIERGFTDVIRRSS